MYSALKDAHTSPMPAHMMPIKTSLLSMFGARGRSIDRRLTRRHAPDDEFMGQLQDREADDGACNNGQA
jgi:hypothetical protein